MEGTENEENVSVRRRAELDAYFAAREQQAAEKPQEEDANSRKAQINRFWNDFNEMQTTAKENLTAATSSEGLAGVIESIRPMEKLLADMSLVLPPYDMRQAQETITALKEEVETKRNETAPRKKFAFRKKVRDKMKKAEDLEAKQDGPQPEAAAASKALFEDERTIANVKGQVLEILPGQLSGGAEAKIDEQVTGTCQDLRLLDIEDSTIILADTMRALRMDNISNCHIYTGAVEGSIILHNCKNCVFMFAARQIRIHTTTHCDFYLHVMSRPIFEHSSNLRFGPYRLTFRELPPAMKAAGLIKDGSSEAAAGELQDNTKSNFGSGMWNQVDDFGWHRAQASPNWKEIPVEDRLSSVKHSGKVNCSIVRGATAK